MKSEEIPDASGIYYLVIKLNKEKTLEIGVLGEVSLKKGRYVYVGSARGPGGLRARISRHLRIEKKAHWHIDYLLLEKGVTVTEIGFIITQKDLECNLVQELREKGATIAVEGFGSSDSPCKSHLLKIVLKRNILEPFTLQGQMFSNVTV